MVHEHTDDEQFNDAMSEHEPEPTGSEPAAQDEQTPPAGNRPAENARVMSVTDSANNLTNVWAAGDEATDFLGLNTELDESSEAASEEVPGPRSWLLDHVGSDSVFSDVLSEEPENSWQVDEAAQAATPGHAANTPQAHAETTGDNWLLDQADKTLEESARGATPADPQMLGTLGDASFVEEAPKSRAAQQWAFRGLAAAAVCAGAFGLWNMTMNNSELGVPDEDVNGLERISSAPDKSTLTEPSDFVAPTGESGPRVSIGGGQAAGTGDTAPSWQEAVRNRQSADGDAADIEGPDGPGTVSSVDPNAHIDLGAVTDAVPLTEVVPEWTDPFEDQSTGSEASVPVVEVNATADAATTDGSAAGLGDPLITDDVESRTTQMTLDDMMPDDREAWSGTLRSAAPFTANHWYGTKVPMEALTTRELVQTPRIGQVRVIFDDGETFHGNLYGLGTQGVLLDEKNGRTSLDATRVARIEVIDSEASDAIARLGRDVAGLPRVRVRALGGVFEGHQVDRTEDRVTLITEKGRITLQSSDVVPAATMVPKIRLRRKD